METGEDGHHIIAAPQDAFKQDPGFAMIFKLLLFYAFW
jgi:hypothetical protein